MTQPKPGYIYAVRQKGSPSVKVGLTTVDCVARYLYESYSRSLSPLEVLMTFPACHVRLAESNMHHILQQYRLDMKHELFDLGDDPMQHLEAAKLLTQQIDSSADLPRPADQVVNIEEWRAGHQAAREQARLQREAKAEQDRQEEREQHKLMKQEVKAKLRAEAYEAKLRAKRSHKLDIVESIKKEARCGDAVGAFVQDHLKHTGVGTDFVQKSIMYDKYRSLHMEEQQKKTKLGKRQWFQQLLSHMGTDGFHAHKKVASVKYRDVWLGWSMTYTSGR